MQSNDSRWFPVVVAIAVLTTGIGFHNLYWYCQMVNDTAEAVHSRLMQ